MRHAWIILVLVAVFVFTERAHAMACGNGCGCRAGKTAGVEQAPDTEVVDTGNDICPVMGSKIVKGQEVKVEHEGKIYNLCCAGCVEPFRKDPKHYIGKLQQMPREGQGVNSCSAHQTCGG